MTMIFSQIQLRRGTAAQWAVVNPILVAGELGVETDTGLIKVGNGTTSWTALPYVGDMPFAPSQAGYCETLYNGDMNPTSVTWYTDETKATKVLETLITYTDQLATTIAVRPYVGGALAGPILTDTIVYDGDGYEMTRTRVKTMP